MAINLDSGEPLKEIHISEAGVPGNVLLSADELGVPQFGRVICSHVLQNILENVTDLSIEQEYVSSIAARSRSSSPSISLSSGEEMSADLIILADGGRSGLTEDLGFEPQLRAFGRTALIGRLEASVPLPGRAFERFVGTGPLAILPVNKKEYGFIWSLTPKMAALYSRNTESLVWALEENLGGMLGDVRISHLPVQVPLVERWIDQPFRPGIVLLGNGAQTIHPVAGQGLNLAIRGLELLISNLRITEVDNALVLAHEAWKPARDQTRAVSSILEAIFDRDNLVRKILTGTGLAFIDQNLWLKRLIADAGMGIRS